MTATKSTKIIAVAFGAAALALIGIVLILVAPALTSMKEVISVIIGYVFGVLTTLALIPAKLVEAETASPPAEPEKIRVCSDVVVPPNYKARMKVPGAELEIEQEV